MTRWRWSEITWKRVRDALVRRVQDLPERWAWSHSSWAHENRERLQRFAQRHRGQRCFIMGNGPSLGKMDLSPLAHEVTFGMNRVYLMFEQWNFQPTYFVSINELVLEQFAADIRSLTMPKFLNWNCREYFSRDDESTLFIRTKLGLGDDFGKTPVQPLSSGGTVTFSCLQLAYFMGCDPVYLLGVDHRFVEKGTPNQTEVRQEQIDRSHCHPDYFPKGSKWQLPDLLRSEQAYLLARHAFEQDGRKVYDATQGGHLDIFEKVDFHSLFA